jgi:hypothetical protein
MIAETEAYMRDYLPKKVTVSTTLLFYSLPGPPHANFTRSLRTEIGNQKN